MRQFVQIITFEIIDVWNRYLTRWFTMKLLNATKVIKWGFICDSEEDVFIYTMCYIKRYLLTYLMWLGQNLNCGIKTLKLKLIITTRKSPPVPRLAAAADNLAATTRPVLSRQTRLRIQIHYFPTAVVQTHIHLSSHPAESFHSYHHCPSSRHRCFHCFHDCWTIHYPTHTTTTVT